jgi:toluene monooxygenase system ferredoxin subunit
MPRLQAAGRWADVLPTGGDHCGLEGLGAMSWKRVCKVTDVPENSLKKFWVDGIELIVVNYGSGLRAIPPICPHMEEPLEYSGVIADCTLTCTKHLWAWNLRSLDKLGETEKSLGIYEVKQEGDDVLAFVDKEIVYEFDEEDDVDDDDFFKKV